MATSSSEPKAPARKRLWEPISGDLRWEGFQKFACGTGTPYTVNIGTHSERQQHKLRLPDINVAVACAKLAYTFIVFLPALFTHFLSNLLQASRRNRYVVAYYLIAVAFLSTVWTSEQFITGVKVFAYGQYAQGGPLHTLFVASIGVPIVHLVFLLRQYEHAQGIPVQRRMQIQYGRWGLWIFCGAVFDFLGNYGYEIYLPGFIFTLASLGIYGYAIVKHRLMDIEVAVSRATQLAILSGVIFGVFIVMTRLLEPFVGFVLASLMTAGFLAFILFGTPLRSKIRDFVEQALWKDRYAYQTALREMSHGLVTILEQDKLLAFLGEVLTETMGAKDVTIWLEDLKQEHYRLIWPSEKTSAGASLHFEHLLIKQLGKLKRATTHEDLTIAEFPAMCGLVIVPFMVRNDHLLGFFCLGEKLERQSYKTSDLETLEALAAQAAIAIENARLYTLAVTEERSGLYTPQHFRQRFEQEIQRCRREKRALMLGLLELPANLDSKVLARVGEVIKKNVRSSDIPAVWEEKAVAVLFPETVRADVDLRTAKVNELAHLAITIKSVLDRIRGNLANLLGTPVAAGATAFEAKNSQTPLDQLLAEAREGARLSREHGADAVYFPPASKLADVFKNPPPLETQDDHLWTVGDLALQPSARKLFIHHNAQDPSWKEIPVSLKEFDLLRFMIQRQGRILTRQFLTEAVWGYEYLGFSRNIDTHISKLREKLKESRCIKIETVKHAGYRLLVSETPSAG